MSDWFGWKDRGSNFGPCDVCQTESRHRYWTGEDPVLHLCAEHWKLYKRETDWDRRNIIEVYQKFVRKMGNESFTLCKDCGIPIKEQCDNADCPKKIREKEEAWMKEINEKYK